MENMEEIEAKILEIVTEQFKKDGGANGVTMGSFDHILNLPIKERNEFLYCMAKEKKIHIFQSLNNARVTLFFNDQMFLKKILKFFLSNLNPSQNLNLSTPALPLIGTAKIQTLFKLATFFSKSFKVFFRLFLFGSNIVSAYLKALLRY